MISGCSYGLLLGRRDKAVRVLGLALLAVVLAACTGQDAEKARPPGVGSEVTKAEFEAYLKLKGIPPKAGDRRDRAWKTFQERNAISEAILEGPLLDKQMIAAEVRNFRNELVIRRYFEAFLEKTVTEDAVRQYYEDNIEKYTKPKVKLAYVPFRTDVTMRASEKSAKLARAVEVQGHLQGGTPFSMLASWYSEDPEARKRGGELGWVGRDEIDPALFEKALSMKKGEVSEVISTPTGHYLIQLLENPVIERVPFEQVKDEIRYRLRAEPKQREMKRLLDKRKQ